MRLKDFSYVLTCISFSIIIGAAVYEHAAVWPTAFAALPRSLSAFQGPYRLDSSPFWMPVHPVTFLLFIVTLIISWRSERKKYVLIPMVTYFIVLIVTFSYFVPELLSLINTPYADMVDKNITSRADRWELLSIIRLIILFVAGILLLSGLTKPNNKLQRAGTA